MNNGNHGFLVRVSCLTYNHSAFIADALNGFAMQQTSFPFVCTIIDDASTDGEQEVVKAYVDEHFDMNDSSVFYEKEEEYGRVTFARHKTNANCYFAVIYLKENHYSQRKSKNPYIEKWVDTKYVALCEGDDYWTDPLKLQKQVDFMEGHPDYSMCFHVADVRNECSAVTTSNYSTIKDGDYGPNDIFPYWVVPTASVVYRGDKVDLYPLKHANWFVYGDIVLFEKCAHVGKLRGMEERMSVYRMNQNSILQNVEYRNGRIQKMPLHFKALKMNFPLINKKVLNQLIADSYYSKMRNDNHLIAKGIDFFCFFFANPMYSTRKLLGKFAK